MSAQLEIREVSKAFGGVQAVTRVSLDVPRGEILSVIGPNGAGKTTLLNMVSGFYHPDTGRIVLDGVDVTADHPSHIASLGVARTFQNIALFRGMTQEEKEDMARFVLDVNEEWGTTIILIEHDMGVVMDISDRVAVLDMGQKIAEGKPDEVRANTAVIRAYLGEKRDGSAR